MNKFLPIFIIIIITACVIGVIVFLSNNKDNETSDNTVFNQDYSQDWKKGAKDPKVVLVEYADFECPACASVKGVPDALLRKYPDELQFVYRHYPLQNSHLHAFKAAEAAEAAGAQGKFWEMHDILFDNQTDLTEDSLRVYASRIDLDMSIFIRDLNNETYAPNVQSDYDSGRAVEVRRTPTFFVNGEEYTGNITLQGLSSAIEDVISTAN
ncbi:MAG: thioredoxin domain-containing protein [bacterium]